MKRNKKVIKVVMPSINNYVVQTRNCGRDMEPKFLDGCLSND